MFKHKPSRSRIPTCNILAQTSSIQNAATSDLPNEVEGAHTGSSQQDQSFPSPLSIEKGVDSGSPLGRFPSPLSIVKGVDSGSPPGRFPSPLSIVKGVDSASPPGCFPSPLSSCCDITSTKDSPCHHEN